MPKAKPSAERVERYARYIIVLLSAYAIIDNYIIGDMITLASAALTVLLLMLPSLIQTVSKLRIPVSVRVVYLIFIICAMYLGEIHSFFYRFLWWDEFLHTCSAMMLAYVGFVLVNLLNRDSSAEMKLRPAFVAVFVFCFTAAFGLVWELFEFSMDGILGVNMLKGRDPFVPNSLYSYEKALVNTMIDLALDAAGALLIALLAFFHLKRPGGRLAFFGLLKRQFMAENPAMFGDISSSDH
ncbi:MAG: hypothetical protein U1B83_03235 [Candidatus Cloacimonadaceae bacterium]|nr:hypothetical protein [Candidatus Cloacimonadaceae bacterium]